MRFQGCLGQALPEHFDTIFEPFFTTKDVGKGTGLGLSQAFGFAKQSGGEIGVRSAPGEGATFTIYLPGTEVAAESVDDAVVPGNAAFGGRGHRVLVVEDNKDVGEFSTELLRDLGYAIRWVTSASAALSLLSEDEFAFDLVFSDVVMPGTNGVELAKIIRDRYPGMPVVLTSGYSHVLAENVHSGFELVQKPYSIELLSRTLRNAIVERRSARTTIQDFGNGKPRTSEERADGRSWRSEVDQAVVDEQLGACGVGRVGGEIQRRGDFGGGAGAAERDAGQHQSEDP